MRWKIDNAINFNRMLEYAWGFLSLNQKGVGFQVIFKVKQCAPDKTKQRHLACVSPS